MKMEWEKQPFFFGCLSHQDHTHGVGVTGAWAPAGQDDDNIPLLEEASDLACKWNQVGSQHSDGCLLYHHDLDNKLHENLPTRTPYPFPWQSSLACQRPRPTRRWTALCTGQERCHGTGGSGEPSERSVWRRGWERGACTWRAGVRTWGRTSVSGNLKEICSANGFSILTSCFKNGLRITKQAHSFFIIKGRLM